MFLIDGEHMEKQDQSKITACNCPNCGAAVATNAPVCAYCDAPLYSRICANCFSAVGISMNHCPNCGAAVMESQRALKKDLKCPVCANMLETHEINSYPIYVCPKCGGLWLDHESFQLIFDRVEKQALEWVYNLPDLKVSNERKSRRTYIPCPECGTIMNPKQFARCSGVVIDTCRKHGHWFDWQELNQVIEFVQKGGMSKSRILELESLKEDLKRERFNWLTSRNNSNRPKFLS